MAVNISYMGTKKELAPAVADVIRHAQPGVMLDAFAGMCTVGEEIAPARQIWSNDIQLFAAEVGRALFTSEDEPPGTLQTANLYFDAFERHRQKLEAVFSKSLDAENALLESQTYSTLLKRRATLATALKVDQAPPRRHHHVLFTSLYANSYFGLRQAIEADSIIHSISTSCASKRTSPDSKRWLMIALGRALLKIANSTGHFAQFLKPKRSSYKRHLRQKRRSLWAEWLFSVGELQPSGTVDWREHNRSFNEDSLLLLPRLAKAKNRPSVIYADPPYTDDQYSRYYHLLDTLFLYDYPALSGAGLYRPGRFQTSFSVKSRAVEAFTQLIRSAAKTGADFVLSYPSNGLVHDAGVDPKRLLENSFRTVECCYALRHTHSTFGASKGSATANVTELVYLART